MRQIQLLETFSGLNSIPVYLQGRSSQVMDCLIQIARFVGHNYQLQNSLIFPCLNVARIFPHNLSDIHETDTVMRELILRSAVYTDIQVEHEYEIWRIFTCSQLGVMRPEYNDYNFGYLSKYRCYDPCFEIFSQNGYYPMAYKNEIHGEIHIDITIKNDNIIFCTEQQKLTTDICDLWLQDMEIQQKLRIDDVKRYIRNYKISKLFVSDL